MHYLESQEKVELACKYLYIVILLAQNVRNHTIFIHEP